MNVGFTGTRFGMTKRQKNDVASWLATNFNMGDQFHHGCCTGSDVQAAAMAKGLGYRTIGHPGPSSEWRDIVWKDDETMVEQKNFARNQDIVRCCHTLLATPATAIPAKGGTWYTIGYAKNQRRKCVIFLP